MFRSLFGATCKRMNITGCTDLPTSAVTAIYHIEDAEVVRQPGRRSSSTEKGGDVPEMLCAPEREGKIENAVAIFSERLAAGRRGTGSAW